MHLQLLKQDANSHPAMLFDRRAQNAHGNVTFHNGLSSS
jgi:hypothetical protein